MRFAIFLAVLALLAGCSKAPSSAGAQQLTVYKSPTCGCCAKWMEHVNANGLATELKSEQDMTTVQKNLGVPDGLHACHVATAGGYLIVGHVPAEDIQRLLREKPKALGLAVRGMPAGSPGMEHGGHREPFDTLLFQADGQSSVFAQHGR
jgi:hypothetical protein